MIYELPVEDGCDEVELLPGERLVARGLHLDLDEAVELLEVGRDAERAADGGVGRDADRDELGGGAEGRVEEAARRHRLDVPRQRRL